MLGRIVRHEWRLLAADRTAAVVVGLFGLMLVAAAGSGARWASAQRAASDDVIARQDARYREARDAVVAMAPSAATPSWGPGNPGYLGSFVGRYVVQPAAPLAALAVGQSDLFASYSKVTARTREAVVTGDQTANPLVLKTGQFDLAFVLLYLYPLFVIALAYDLTSSEREDGTLRLVAAQPVALAHLVTAKVVARGVLVLLPALVVPALALAVDGAAGRGDAATRLGVWTAAVTAYGLVWFALAVCVNALARTPAYNALVLAGAWLAVVVIVPAGLNVAVGAAYPVPSRVEFINAARAATDDARVAGSRVLGRFIEEHPEFAIAGDAMKNASVLQAARDDDIERQVAPVVARFDAQLARQQDAVARWRYLSPAAVLQSVLVDAAGTGIARYRHFFAQADAFHRQWRDHFQPLLFASQPLTPAAYDTLPRFGYAEEPAAAVVGRSLAPIGALVLVAASLLWAGLIAYRQFPLIE